MNRAGLFCLLLLTSAAHAAGDARAPRPNKAHLLTDHLIVHLHPATRANTQSLVRYQGKIGTGSGVLVGARPGRRGKLDALVLTNRHVIHGNHDFDATVNLMGGGTARLTRVVAQSRFLDYALLAVELPALPNLHVATPTTHIADYGEGIYSLGAATSMTEYKLHDFVRLGAREQASMQAAIDNKELYEFPIISTGKMLNGYPQYGRLSTGARMFQQAADTANAPGSSGGPVFSKQTHELVGLDASGARNLEASESGIVPMSFVLYDLSKKLTRGVIAPRFRDRVGALLESAPPQPAPTEAP
jgi:hypothetical protein